MDAPKDLRPHQKLSDADLATKIEATFRTMNLRVDELKNAIGERDQAQRQVNAASGALADVQASYTGLHTELVLRAPSDTPWARYPEVHLPGDHTEE